ncbi:hypothetical protein KL918_005261 [Ogataea parapolymorpha]|uniref:MFS transporter n=1 Tax=Ogataea parapolymorpha (strain ATCC 26012 / BCRC 20466 / JCM 22074 / NRRL Y-7560 / DL-1) TaxID=871575 RepID=W1QEN0_OGAPD|nr:MFS transporter [Ogataea parapolymorpha DL-1]ESX00032.1 MFS transporter [Ogataea parapolymorpha DL-1]KAG7864770.1 hypothetical protein KL918_005261 [Ogataea parapolymorpha]KAG7870970.1 hypothetical protein KL916_004521 [Ogataea parapolymorpha]
MSLDEIKDSQERLESQRRKFYESDAGDGTKRADQYLHGAKLWMCIISIMLCMFLVALDQTISFTILVQVSEKFRSFEKLTWITSSFVLGIGCTAQVWGRLSIIFGRRWVMLASVFLFEVGSLVCSVSKSMNMLIGGRAIQGVGGAGIQACVMNIATEVTTIDKKPMIMALVSVTFVAASVIGPILGGVFTSYSTWRWCFYINLCFAAVIVPLFLYSFRPKTPAGSLLEKTKKIDYPGAVTMVAGLVLILLAISFGDNEFKWNSAAIICLFVIGGVLLILFCIWDFFFAQEPLLPLEIVATYGVTVSVVQLSTVYGSFMVLSQFLVVYFQTLHNESAFHAGLSLLPSVIPLVLGAVFTGLLIQKTRHVKLYGLIGTTFASIGVGILTLLQADSAPSKRYGLQVLYGLGVGVTFQAPMMSVQLCCPKTPGSTILAMTFIYFGRSVATALFSQLGEAIYTATLRKKFSHIQPLIPDINLELVVSNSQLLHTLDAQSQTLIKKAMMDCIRNAFYLSLALMLIGSISAVIMSNKRIPPKDEVERD